MAGTVSKKDDEIVSLDRQVEWLTQQLRLMQGQKFGASSEQTQVLSEQCTLFNEAEALPLYRQEQELALIGVPVSR